MSIPPFAPQHPRHDTHLRDGIPLRTVVGRRFALTVVITTIALAAKAAGQEAAAERSDKADDSVTSVTSDSAVQVLLRRIKPATVVILGTSRDGTSPVSGTGFFISADGLVATNLHVIGEGRPFVVRTADGQQHPIQSIHASDRRLDLAIVQVEGSNFPYLELGTDDQLPQGAPVVALGHPHGLNYSVVRGILSSRRQLEGREMLQLAIPIEPGNSGGPLIDLQGRVHGILTMKSLVTDNLGFAVSVNHLRRLLERPNPVARDIWLRRGELDREQWLPRFGANWRQLPAKITVESPGDGFGGRSLCLSNQKVPERPFEVAVQVKLDDEAGAAGLVFHSDGEYQHYAFYPTNGHLRLTHFAGPNVFSWNILDDVVTPHYRRGEWNHLKVRVDNESIACYVNDQLVMKSTDSSLISGQIGLAKFRETRAEFRQFAVGNHLPRHTPDDGTLARVNELIEATVASSTDAPDRRDVSLDELSQHVQATQTMVDRRITELQRQIEQLESIAAQVHVRKVVGELAREMAQPGELVNLGRVALLISQLDNADVDIDAYLAELDRLAADIQRQWTEDPTDEEKLEVMDRVLFQQQGYHGSRAEYYTAANSYLDRVIDDREGLPITLSVFYLEIARRLELPIEGVGLPGHFVVRLRQAEREDLKEEQEGSATEPPLGGLLIDVFDGGRRMRREEIEAQVRLAGRNALTSDDLAAASKKAIAVRMLRNLLSLARSEGDGDALQRYLEAMLAIDEQLVEERLMRAIVRHENHRTDAALEDLDWLLENAPDTVEQDAIRQLKRRMLLDQDRRRRP